MKRIEYTVKTTDILGNVRYLETRKYPQAIEHFIDMRSKLTTMRVLLIRFEYVNGKCILAHEERCFPPRC